MQLAPNLTTYEGSYAKSWTHSSDFKTYTYTLHSGAKWSDGKPFKIVRGPVQFNHEPLETTRAPQASEHTELVLMEDLGFSERGQAWKDIESGRFDLGGGELARHQELVAEFDFVDVDASGKLPSAPQAEYAHRGRAKIQFLEIHAHSPATPSQHNPPRNGHASPSPFSGTASPRACQGRALAVRTAPRLTGFA